MEFFTLVKEATKHDNRSWSPAHSQNTHAHVRLCGHPKTIRAFLLRY